MSSNKKLSTFLNGYYSYDKIKECRLDEIMKITSEYIQNAEDKIYKQPIIALRTIKIELIDIYSHHEKYVNELKLINNEIQTLISDGPWLNESDKKSVEKLEEKRDILAEFVYSIEDSLGYMMRMLLEHYSELHEDKPFFDKFSTYLSPFDWMSKRAEQLHDEFTLKADHSTKARYLEFSIAQKARGMIRHDELKEAFDLLISNSAGQTVKNDLIKLQRKHSELMRNKRLGQIKEEDYEVKLAKITKALLETIEEAEKALS